MSTPDPSEIRSLTAVVAELRIATATLTETVRAMQATFQRLERNSVSLEKHEALRTDHEEFKVEAKAGIQRNDDRWSKVAWFVGLAILGAMLALVLSQGGTPQ